jgi:ankyrin repeat protein
MKRYLIAIGLLLLIAGCATVQTTKERDVDVLLRMAAEKGDTNVLLLFLEEGADINAKNARGGTALSFAVSNGRLETVKVLLAKGADINARDIHGYTALIWAAWDGYTKIVKLLLVNGADVNARNDLDVTALGAAKLKSWDRAEVIKLLKEAGARE